MFLLLLEIFPPPPVAKLCIVMFVCVWSVCLLVREHISGTTRSNITEFSAYYVCGRDRPLTV